MKIFTLTGPTASGKSTIADKICEERDDLYLSVSSTTRKKRPDEVDGEDYHYLGFPEFEEKVKNDEFIEHARFSGNRYGTEKKNLTTAEELGKTPLLVIEVEGVRQLKELYPDNVCCIFIFPVSFMVLEKRLLLRAKDNEEQVKMRLETARKEVEILESPGFSDFKVVNEDLETAVKEVQTIIDTWKV